MDKKSILWGGWLVGVALLLGVACSSGEETPGRSEVDAVAPADTMARNAGGTVSDESAMAPGKTSGAEAATASGGAAAPSGAVDILGRKIVRNGSLTLEVESVTGAYDEVAGLASRVGGYVAEGTYSGSGNARTGRLVIRVSAGNYERAVSELQGLARNVTAASSTTQDVTGEVSDLDAALRNLRAVEAQYVAFLSQARTIPDLLQVQERLQGVRGDIERTEARLALLNRLSDLATITVQLTPIPAVMQTPQDGPSPLRAASAAWAASLDTLRQVAVVAVAVVVYSWWLAPGIAGAAYLGRRRLRSRRILSGTAS